MESRMTSSTRRCRWVRPSPASVRSGKARTAAVVSLVVVSPELRRPPDVPLLLATCPPRRGPRLSVARAVRPSSVAHRSATARILQTHVRSRDVSGRFCRSHPVDIGHTFESNRRSSVRTGREGDVVGSVQQAVLEFDESVQAPWRPALQLVPPDGPGERRPPTPPGAYRDRVARSGPARPADAATRPARAAAPRVPARPVPRPPVRGGCAPMRRPVTGRVRLTRRARRLAVVLALASGVALGSWLGPLVAGDSGDLRLTGASTVTVESGDTLWSVASSVAGDRDVRLVVDEIQRLNHL